VADGFWILATRHHPGLSQHTFEINNRCFIFRLQDSKLGGPVLAVVNAVDPVAGIPEVRRLEHETGLQVRYVISPGAGHHLMLDAWHQQFTSAQILVGPVRVPRTLHGQKLMKLPRVATMDPADPLPQFRGQLDAVLFQGLLGHPEMLTPAETGKPDSKLAMIKRMARFMTTAKTDPVDELWLHHVPSGTVLAGENMAWYYRAEDLRAQPFMLRSMVKPDRVWLWPMPRKVGAADQVRDSWRRILAWPAHTLMTFHDPATVAYVGDVRAALEAAARTARQL
jgi:hypothetical protein